MTSQTMLRKSCVRVLVIYTVAIFFSSIAKCSSISDEVNIISKEKKEGNHDHLLPEEAAYLVIPDFPGEARIFGNFSFGNSSILTVAGFVIVGIILFGKTTTFIFKLKPYNRSNIW